MPPLWNDLMLGKKPPPRFIGSDQVEQMNELVGEDGVKAQPG